MVAELQRASIWKRIAAWMFDTILFGVIAIGIAFLLSAVLGYDEYSKAVSEAYEKYENQYSVSFDIDEDTYNSYSEEERARYNSAREALLLDDDAIYAYNMTVNLSLMIVSISVLISVMLWEFVIPLILGEGRTLGKKIFGLCLVRANGVRINHLQMLVRALLGKYTVEIMIPLYAVLMLVLGSLNLLVLLLVAILFIAQVICVIITETNSPIHDLLAGTVVVDGVGQMIFNSEEEMLEFKKQQHAEQIARKPY